MSSVETVQADIYGKSPQFALGFAVNLKLLLGFLHSSVGKESACNAGDPVRFLGWEDPLEKEMATHFSILV